MQIDETKETLSWLGELTIIHIDGEMTNGHYSVLELYATEEGSPPWHVHQNEDEAFYVLEGEFTFGVGEKTIKAKQGDYLLAPKKIPHIYKVNSGKGRLLITCSPAGFENAVREMSRPVTRNSPPDMEKDDPGFEKLEAISQKYSVHFTDTPEGSSIKG